jgi:pyruvate,water dikinase
MPKRWTLWLEEVGQEHAKLVGRKCANLGEMTRMKLPVPPGFAINTETYLDFMHQTAADQEIREYLSGFSHANLELSQLSEISLKIRQIVQSKGMPFEIEEDIVNHYRELCRKCRTAGVAVSVRSAGPVSHPGQYETYLNVTGESDVLDKIKKVWASTFNPRSLAFRNQSEIILESDPIGIAVLKMVNARAAGVVFTADPNNGDTSRMLIEANWGLGESVVNGESTPDVFIVDKNNLEIQEKRLGPKYRCVVLDNKGVSEVSVPPDKSSNFCLNDEEVKAIVKLAKVLEDHFGLPQDIEWAIDQDTLPPDNVVLLQTRPAIIAPKKSSVDQIADLMLEHFSGGAAFGSGLNQKKGL